MDYVPNITLILTNPKLDLCSYHFMMALCPSLIVVGVEVGGGGNLKKILLSIAMYLKV